MDQLTHLDVIAFDKTGTLTLGQPQVVQVEVLQGDKQEIINLAVNMEKESTHPLAQAFQKFKTTKRITPDQLETIKGQGLIASVNKQKYYLGNLSLIQKHVALNAELVQKVDQLAQTGNSIVIFANQAQTQLAVFAISDQLRPDAIDALTQLKQSGLKLVMLTGDNEKTAQQTGLQLPLDEIQAELLPEAKARYLEKMQAQGQKEAFVGDGINDAPALAQADVAVAMGGGTDVAIDVSNLILVKSDLTKLVVARKLSQTTIRNMNENIILALITVVLLFIGLFVGYIEMASGMLIHELSILIVILNSMRLIKYSPKIDHRQFFES